MEKEVDFRNFCNHDFEVYPSGTYKKCKKCGLMQQKTALSAECQDIIINNYANSISAPELAKLFVGRTITHVELINSGETLEFSFDDGDSVLLDGGGVFFIAGKLLE